MNMENLIPSTRGSDASSDRPCDLVSQPQQALTNQDHFVSSKMKQSVVASDEPSPSKHRTARPEQSVYTLRSPGRYESSPRVRADDVIPPPSDAIQRAGYDLRKSLLSKAVQSAGDATTTESIWPYLHPEGSARRSDANRSRLDTQQLKSTSLEPVSVAADQVTSQQLSSIMQTLRDTTRQLAPLEQSQYGDPPALQDLIPQTPHGELSQSRPLRDHLANVAFSKSSGGDFVQAAVHSMPRPLPSFRDRGTLLPLEEIAGGNPRFHGTAFHGHIAGFSGSKHAPPMSHRLDETKRRADRQQVPKDHGPEPDGGPSWIWATEHRQWYRVHFEPSTGTSSFEWESVEDGLRRQLQVQTAHIARMERERAHLQPAFVHGAPAAQDRNARQEHDGPRAKCDKKRARGRRGRGNCGNGNDEKAPATVSTGPMDVKKKPARPNAKTREKRRMKEEATQ